MMRPDRLGQTQPALLERRGANGKGIPDGIGPGFLDSGGLLAYWQMLRRSTGLLVVCLVAGVLAGVLLTLPQTPIYQARASLEVQNLNDNYLNLRGVEPISINSAADSYIQTQIQVLQSESLVRRVVQTLNEQSGSAAASVPAPASWRSKLGVGGSEPASDVARAIKSASSTLRIRGSGLTRIVQIYSDSEDPKIAADFVNTLARQYVDSNIEARWNAAQHTSEWLMRQLKELQAKLQSAEGDLQRYATASGLVVTSGAENSAEMKLRQIQEELVRAQADRMAKQSKYEQAKISPAYSIPEVLDDGTLRGYQAKLAELMRERADLQAIATSEHPKVERIEAQIAEVRSILNRERQNIIDRIKIEFESARRREELLLTAHVGQGKTVREQAVKAIYYNILKREADTTRQLYEAMLQKTKEAGIASALSVTNIRVVDPARPPERPYRPSMAFNAFMGLCGGGLLGIVLASMRDRADRRLRDPEDVLVHLNLPELGIIPSASSDPITAPLAKRQNPIAMLMRGGGPATTGADRPEPAAPTGERLELVLAQRPYSMMAEAYRGAVTSILFCVPRPEKQVIAFSSPGPSEGKTTTATNIALALASMGQRVLLIDADFRRPRLHNVFDAPRDITLSALLRSRPPDPDTPLEQLVQTTQFPGLFLLPTGSEWLDTPNLLHSPRLGSLLQRFRAEFDLVLIDSAPILNIFDARVVGRLADALILVIRLGHTTKDSMISAIRRLAEDGAFLLGTILNDWTPQRSHDPAYRYGYRYVEVQSESGRNTPSQAPGQRRARG